MSRTYSIMATSLKPSFNKTKVVAKPSCVLVALFPNRRLFQPSPSGCYPLGCHSSNIKVPLINPRAHCRQFHEKGPDHPRPGSAKSLKLSPEGVRRLRNVNRLTTGFAVIFVLLVCEVKGFINIRGVFKKSLKDDVE